ncbi:D-alanyl-D-alanine carboxypeptidase family protein [Phosphitispora sp. TUW77]|uniref:D-alanyl-D-alanine carboxypeptidase family protein n=1 Tax=Phosphitispora sp. TUW77 TaxID=3152361 RepID=UPI003AB85031
MKFKKMFCVVTVILMMIVQSAQVSAQAELETTAESAILVDAVTGKILFAKEPDKELPPASVTKVMTLLAAFDAIEKGRAKLTDIVQTSENASQMGGSQIYLEPGEEMSLKTMLIAVAVGSANDCCVAIAEHIAGSHEAFVKIMNEKAAQLGCKHTHFVNAYGLPAEGHYTSAGDLALMMREAIKHPLFLELTSIKRYDLRGGEFILNNTNKLLWWYRGTLGGKTGWTSEAKYCLASITARDNLKLIAVVMATPEPRSHFRESMKLYNYGFAKYEAVPIAASGQVMGKVRVGKGTVDWVEAASTGEVGTVVQKGQKETVTHKVVIDCPAVTAPVDKGQVLGKVVVYEEGKRVYKVDLAATKDIPKGTVFRQMFKLMKNVYSYSG